MLVIRVDFSDLPDSAHLASTLQSVMDTQVRPKFQQSSYGLADIVTTVTAYRYRMPRTANYYATTADRRGLMEDAVAAASANYTVADYDRHVVVFPSFSNIQLQNHLGGLLRHTWRSDTKRLRAASISWSLRGAASLLD